MTKRARPYLSEDQINLLIELLDGEVQGYEEGFASHAEDFYPMGCSTQCWCVAQKETCSKMRGLREVFKTVTLEEVDRFHELNKHLQG